MKRWMWVILLTSLAALLVGCGAANSGTVTSEKDVQRITPQEAKTLVDNGEAILYDTRSTDSYEDQHAAGAISLPEDDVAARFDELPDESDTALIFYCT